MSKKNKLSTKRNRHTNDLKREKEETLKKQKKAEKKAEKQAAKLGPAAAVKTKRKGFRIKKGKKIKGIKITDAASKKKVKKLLAAEQALREMEVDKAAGWTEAGACEAME